jgi:predicted TIM-barrel fold metal-dependent hydrolase
MIAGWDCHAHVFGPYARYPLAAGRSYTPPEALLPDYLAQLALLGLSHGVLVHPSAYGSDRTLLLGALAAQPRLRGVIVARPGELPTLNGLHDAGVRALRFSHRSGAGTNFQGSASFEDLLTLAPAMAGAGLHAELWTDCKVLPDIAPQLRTLPLPVVIDHMGGFDVDAGIDDPNFRTLLSLIESSKIWVKLCAYRNLLKAAGIAQGLPFHQALVAANPTQLVWGSDWPHLNVAPAPDALQLLDKMKRWTANADITRQILVSNPNRLYL